MASHVVFTSAQGVQVHVERGKKSKHDFKVRFMGPHGRLRTPKHIHLVIELYVKHAFKGPLTLRLRDYFLQVFNQLKPITQYPPTLQVYQSVHVAQFASLNAVGEFPVDLLMVISELISIQEKTNYPDGSATVSLYGDFMVKDMFSLIHSATWLGRRGKK